MEISSTLPEAYTVQDGGAGIRATQKAQELQRSQGDAAVQLIESAGQVAQQQPADSGIGQRIDIRV